MIIGLASALLAAATGAPQPSATSTGEVSPQRALLDQYCVTCHSERIVSRPVEPDENLQITQLRLVGHLFAQMAAQAKVVAAAQAG